MTKSSISRRSATVSCCIFSLASACLAADDPQGWTKARWGMTEQQVQEAVPGQAVRLAGADWRVTYEFEPETKRLTAVLLQPVRVEDTTEDDFIRVESLLVQKYGRPWNRAGVEIRRSQWTMPQTVITLERVESRRINFRALSLRYERRRDHPI